ncbi:STAS domain-containing protein [candidate division KSB1 bacterium]|nr:STAS domain-containing protein [candidate division KSB1 bacterium]
MYVRTKIIKDITFIYPHVRNLDSTVAFDFAKQLKEIIQTGRTRKFIINLKYVQLIDSSGFGSLVISRKVVSDRGEVVLVNSNGHIDHLFKVMQFNKMFDIFPTERAAFDHLVKINEVEMLTIKK